MDRWSEPQVRPPSQSPWTFPILVAIIIASAGVLAWRWGRPASPPPAQPRTVEARGDLAESERTTIEIFRRISPSVVHIASVSRADSLFSMDPTEIEKGTGSGFIWDDQGHVVTNYHVILGADRLVVTLSDGRTFDARYVGGSASRDLAVLQIDGSGDGLAPIPVGTSSDLQVGQTVLAIGNPFGLDQTLTTGVVSGLDRRIRGVNGTEIKGVIQTDAAINPGNSGGPLLDSAGRLIGVNTSIVSPSGAYAGIGFAVPADTVNDLVPRIIQRGQAPSASIGATFLSDATLRSRGIRGAVVASINPGGPAERAGLLPTIRRSERIYLGDRIIGLNDRRIQSKQQLEAELAGFEVGDSVRLTVERGRGVREVTIVLEAAES